MWERVAGVGTIPASRLLSALTLFALAVSNEAQGIADSGAMKFGSDVDRHSLIVDFIGRDKFKAAIGLQTEDKCNPEVLSFVVHRLGPLHRQRERVRQLGLARP